MIKPRLILSIWMSASLIFLNPSNSRPQDRPMGELTEGQWAEGRAFDPFGDRPIQLWLPEGTLIYGIEPSDRGGPNNWKYRFAITYHGYPVNLRLQKNRGQWAFKKDPVLDTKFRLNQSVFCPAETSPLIWPALTCLHGDPRGEGWTFEFRQPTPKDDGGLPFFDVQATPDEQTKKDLGESKGLYHFRIIERDMDLYEKRRAFPT